MQAIFCRRSIYLRWQVSWLLELDGKHSAPPTRSPIDDLSRLLFALELIACFRWHLTYHHNCCQAYSRHAIYITQGRQNMRYFRQTLQHATQHRNHKNRLGQVETNANCDNKVPTRALKARADPSQARPDSSRARLESKKARVISSLTRAWLDSTRADSGSSQLGSTRAARVTISEA